MQIFNTTGIHRLTKRFPMTMPSLIALITAVLAPQDFSTDGNVDIDSYASWRVSNTLESIGRTCPALESEGLSEVEVLDKWIAYLGVQTIKAEHAAVVADYESKVHAIRSEVDRIAKSWYSKLPLLGKFIIRRALDKGDKELSKLTRPEELVIDLTGVDTVFDILFDDIIRHAPLSYYVKRADDVKKYYESE